MPKPQYTYRARVVKVIDADTIDLRVDAGFHIELSIRTRLLGINAPELSTAKGKEARDYLAALLPVGTEVTVKTFKDPKDKYGRWLAMIFQADFIDSVNERLVHAGHAVAYPAR